jgi:tyrosinase
MRVRKNIRDLDQDEVYRLRQAFEALYADPNQRFQSFAKILLNDGHATRNDLDFLTWNRAFFWAFENLLVAQDASLALPYWDYTEPESIKSGLPDILTELTYNDPNDPNTPLKANPLHHGFGMSKLITYRETKAPAGLALAREIATKALTMTDYPAYSIAFYPADVVSHAWIGGSLTDLHAAPFDPLFWFSHCNLDRYWNLWQQGYSDLGASSMPLTVLGAKLKPFKLNDSGDFLTGQMVLNTTDLDYQYGG